MVKKKRYSLMNKTREPGRAAMIADEVVSARDRFKGALLDLLPHSEDSTEPSEEDFERTKPPQKRKRRKLQEDSKAQQAFVMKLFDRSVDLAQFHEDSPLFPICRAWMLNQPNQKYNDIKVAPRVEVKNKTEDDDKSVKEAYFLPPPEPLEDNQRIRIPKVIPYETEIKEGDGVPTKEELLADNLKHWSKVKKSWLQASADNENRYKESIEILIAISNEAQAQGD